MPKNSYNNNKGMLHISPWLMLISLFHLGPLFRHLGNSEARLADTEIAELHMQQLHTCSSLTNSQGCFHQPEEACPAKGENICACHQLPNCNSAVVCCNVDSYRLNEGLACANVTTLTAHGEVIAIHIRNATLDILNVTRPEWRRLDYFSVTDGHIGAVSGEFGKHARVSCLNFSGNGIKHFENRSLVNLFNLKMLDLSRNNLSDVPRFKKEGLVKLDIFDNKEMLCSSLKDVLKRQEHLEFKHHNESKCLTSKNFNWFNSTEYLPLEQVELVHSLRTNCLPNCTCEPSRMDFKEGKTPTVAASVTCVGLQLTALPTPLPANTVFLNVSHNNITSLEPLNDDLSYQNVRELYLDHNQITTMLPLEGTKFIASFVQLSLKYNKLQTVPTYILSNIFDRNYASRQVMLGHNKLFCDCTTAKVLKVWLLTKQKHIPDSNEIYCENLNIRVLDLDPSKLCQSQQDWTDYIYYIILCEILLFIGLIAKVSYDYWIFKTAGYLPWPANKMPKLPCDWLCE